jgi:hypothetical protein
MLRGENYGFAFHFTEPEQAREIYRRSRQIPAPIPGVGYEIVLSLGGPHDTRAARICDALIGRHIYLRSALWGALIYRIQPALGGLPVVAIPGSDRLVVFKTSSAYFEHVADYMYAWGFAAPPDWGNSC